MNRKEVIFSRLESLSNELSNQTCLVAVTKKSPIEDIQIAYDYGQRDFGENRVEDLLEKSAHFQSKGYKDINWHFIGHLQGKKVSKLLKVPGLTHIHAIDSLKLLENLLSKSDLFEGDSLQYFLQFNTSGEDEKHGLSSNEELLPLITLIQETPESSIELAGLMTMSRIRTEDFEKDAQACFHKLRLFNTELSKRLGGKKLKLSMGMTNDYKVALEYKSDFVRIGSGIFSE